MYINCIYGFLSLTLSKKYPDISKYFKIVYSFMPPCQLNQASRTHTLTNSFKIDNSK